jgi:hypothetical protein
VVTSTAGAANTTEESGAGALENNEDGVDGGDGTKEKGDKAKPKKR